jgi:uncharacterized membrane protein
MKDLFRRRAADERGTVLVLVSIAMTALIGFTALAVDIGQLTNNNRTLQARADVISLYAARTLGGQTAAVLSGPTGATVLAVQASATRNGVPFTSVTVELGNMSGTNFTAIATSVLDGVIQAVNSGSVPKAVRITAKGAVDFAFRPGGHSGSRSAVAVQEAYVGASIGSFLVGTTGAQNTVLNAIFGDSFHAQVVSYQGLASANVTTSLRKLGLNMPVTVMSPTEVLNTSISTKKLMLASAAALNDGNHTTAVNVLNALAASVTTETFVKLGDFIKVEQGGEAAAADAELNVFQLLTAAAFVVDGSHAITIPAAQVNLAGFGDITLELDVISPPQTKLGMRVNDSISNTQVHLKITPQLHVSTAPTVNGCSLKNTLGSLLSLNLSETTTCLLGGVVSRVVTLDLNASIPIDLNLGAASATLTSINCASPQSITLSPTVSPLTVASNIDMTFTGTLLGNSLGNVLRVRADAGLVSQSNPSPQTFLHPTEFGIPRTVTSNALSLAGLTNLNVSDTTVLNANLGPVSAVLGSAAVIPVNAAFSALDTGLITPLVHGLGLGIGGADLTAVPNSLNCNGLRLAA